MRKTAAKVDVIAALVMAGLAVWFWLAAGWAQEQAIREYGHNVDSGALESVVASLFFLPAAILLMLASRFLAWGWRGGVAIHWLAWAWAVLPWMLVLVSEFARIFLR